MNEEQAIAARARVLAAGFTPALWLAPDERFLPPDPPPRTVTLQEALEAIAGDDE